MQPRQTYMSAIPTFYWVVFGLYEPFLAIGGAVGAVFYPKQTYMQQAPWPGGEAPADPLPKATMVTILQLAHTVGLLGIINACVLWTARKHLWSQPAIQEKVVSALLTPLLFGDVLHIALTLWALGEERWNISQWEGILWVTIVAGLTLMIPRIAWHLGVGRYVDARDGQFGKKI